MHSQLLRTCRVYNSQLRTIRLLVIYAQRSDIRQGDNRGVIIIVEELGIGKTYTQQEVGWVQVYFKVKEGGSYKTHLMTKKYSRILNINYKDIFIWVLLALVATFSIKLE